MDDKEKTRLWARMLHDCRAFLEARGFLEVTTPCLVPAGAFEAAIDPLEVVYRGGKAQLQTSPEIAMKVLLAKVDAPIFQIAHCFRDDPPSPIHRREFTMLEFYRPQKNAQDIALETIELIQSLTGEKVPLVRTSVDELFIDLGIDLSKLPTPELLRADLRKKALVDARADDTWNDMFFRVWLEKIEPGFDPTKLTWVDGYPSSLSPLSQRIKGGLFAERFEIFWQGMELCNGCSELTDAATLKKHWGDENAARKLRNASPHPFPVELYATLEHGLAPCAGVAIGMDRLFLCVAKQAGLVNQNALL